MKAVYEWLTERRAAALGVSVEELEKQIKSLVEKEKEEAKRARVRMMYGDDNPEMGNNINRVRSNSLGGQEPIYMTHSSSNGGYTHILNVLD